MVVHLRTQRRLPTPGPRRGNIRLTVSRQGTMPLRSRVRNYSTFMLTTHHRRNTRTGHRRCTHTRLRHSIRTLRHHIRTLTRLRTCIHHHFLITNRRGQHTCRLHDTRCHRQSVGMVGQ